MYVCVFICICIHACMHVGVWIGIGMIVDICMLYMHMPTHIITLMNVLIIYLINTFVHGL